MVNKLKQCPLCGEEERIIIKTEGTFSDFGLYRSIVRCAECGVIVDRYEKTPYAAEARVIETWNTRAERTCEVVYDGDGCPYCGECRSVLYGTSGYCPDCGVRLVE